METDGVIEGKFCRELGRLLFEKRRQMELHQQDMAAELGVHRNTLMRWESGDQAMPLWMILRAADLLSCNFLSLIPSREYVWGRSLPAMTRERDPNLTKLERTA